DETVAAFRARPLEGSPYTYVWLDALTILGLDLFTSEDGAGWTQFLRGLVARGFSGVRLVISDDHAGLVSAIAAVLPGASWQRCRTHFVRKPAHPGAEVGSAVRGHPGALDLRPAIEG